MRGLVGSWHKVILTVGHGVADGAAGAKAANVGVCAQTW